MKPRTVLMVLGVLVGSAVCVRAGLWQLSRWQQKHALRARLERVLVEPPLACGGTPPAPERAIGRRISLVGRYDESRQFLLRGRLHEGEQGVEVVTPLIVAGGPAVLVERGWLAAVDGATARPADCPEPGERAVVGYVERLERSPAGYPYVRMAGDSLALYSAALLDPDSLAARLPYPIAPYLVRESPGPAVAPWPRRSAPEPPNDTMHLSYAVQWFSFAAILLLGSAWLAWSRRDRRSRKPAR